jgi:hypothetical protein
LFKPNLVALLQMAQSPVLDKLMKTKKLYCEQTTRLYTMTCTPGLAAENVKALGDIANTIKTLGLPQKKALKASVGVLNPR